MVKEVIILTFIYLKSGFVRSYHWKYDLSYKSVFVIDIVYLFYIRLFLFHMVLKLLFH